MVTDRPSVMTAAAIGLLTHKCGLATHELGNRLRTVLEDHGIRLQIDPFRPGDDIAVRIQTLELDSVIFLMSTESLGSRPCRRELAAARAQGFPVFTIHLSGSVPHRFTHRLYQTLPVDDTSFQKQTSRLAEAIHARVRVARNLRALAAQWPEEARSTARLVAEGADETSLGELVPLLAHQFSQVSDPMVQRWLAVALGRAGTPAAGRLLIRLGLRDHPLAQHGIVDALKAIRDRWPRHPIAKTIDAYLLHSLHEEASHA
jgi:methylmalonyl-CoA mutase cobalamin-binding subunit